MEVDNGRRPTKSEMVAASHAREVRFPTGFPDNKLKNGFLVENSSRVKRVA